MNPGHRGHSRPMPDAARSSTQPRSQVAAGMLEVVAVVVIRRTSPAMFDICGRQIAAAA